MKVGQIRQAVRDLKAGVQFHTPGDIDSMFKLMMPLEGLALSDFGYAYVSHEAVVTFLIYQCRYGDGTFDEQELSDICGLLRKKVSIV